MGERGKGATRTGKKKKNRSVFGSGRTNDPLNPFSGVVLPPAATLNKLHYNKNILKVRLFSPYFLLFLLFLFLLFLLFFLFLFLFFSFF